MSESKFSKDLRPLGRIECFHVARNAIGYYNNVAVTGRYSISSQTVAEAGSIEALIYAILRNIVPRHPSMGIGVLGRDTKNPSWKRLSRIDLSDVVRFVEMNDMDQFLERGHSTPFERVTELPLWRVIVGVSQNGEGFTTNGKDVNLTVGFFFHHAICDGISGAVFHMDFSELLNMGNFESHNSATGNIVELPPTDLLPSLEELKTFTLSYWKIAPDVFNTFFPPNTSSLWTGSPITAPTEDSLKTRISTLHMSADTAANLILLCRKNSTTFTPLIVTTLASILAEMHPEYTDFSSVIPISFRHFTGVGKRAMVDHFSYTTAQFSTLSKANHFQINPSGGINWDAVRACKSQITAAAASPADQPISLLRRVNDYVTYVKNQVGKKRSHSMEVSNLGLVTLHNDDENADCRSRCTRLTLSQSVNVTSSAYVFSIASVTGGHLAIALTWQEGVAAEVEVKELMSKLKTNLMQLANETIK